MAKLKRIKNKIFGATASTVGSPDTGAEIGQFGSALLGTYNATSDVEVIQSLPAYEKGFIGAVIPDKQYPTLPEMTGVNKVLSYQTGYLFQEGIPEWDKDTTYYKNGIVKYFQTTYTKNIKAVLGDATGINGVSVNEEKFKTKISQDGIYTIKYINGQWDYTGSVIALEDYGISVQGEPAENDTIIITLSTVENISDAKLFISQTNENIGNNPESDENNWKTLELGGGGAGMPVGTIFSHTATASSVPENSLPCDGTEYSKKQFGALYNDWLVAKKLETCSYAEYQQEISATGECLKWGIDTVRGTFKVPTKLNLYVSPNGGGTAPVKGNGLNLGLTDGTNFYGISNGPNTGMTATKGSYGQKVGHEGWQGEFFGLKSLGVTKDASKSGMVADLSGSIKTKEIRYFVVVATGSIKQSEMDWSAWASGLDGKLNKDMTNLPVTNDIVIEYKVNSNGSWYRKYKSGWLEQGGKVPVSVSKSTVTFLKPFSNILYTVTTSKTTGSLDSWFTPYVVVKRTTGMDMASQNSGVKEADWYACGQGA